MLEREACVYGTSIKRMRWIEMQEEEEQRRSGAVELWQSKMTSTMKWWWWWWWWYCWGFWSIGTIFFSRPRTNDATTSKCQSLHFTSSPHCNGQQQKTRTGCEWYDEKSRHKKRFRITPWQTVRSYSLGLYKSANHNERVIWEGNISVADMRWYDVTVGNRFARNARPAHSIIRNATNFVSHHLSSSRSAIILF